MELLMLPQEADEWAVLDKYRFVGPNDPDAAMDPTARGRKRGSKVISY